MLFSSCHKSPNSSSSSCNKDIFILYLSRNWKKKHKQRLSLEIWIVLDAISIRGTHDSSPEWNLGEIGQSVSHFLVKPCLDRR